MKTFFGVQADRFTGGKIPLLRVAFLTLLSSVLIVKSLVVSFPWALLFKHFQLA
jgi:hypothetical protein